MPEELICASCVGTFSHIANGTAFDSLETHVRPSPEELLAGGPDSDISVQPVIHSNRGGHLYTWQS